MCNYVQSICNSLGVKFVFLFLAGGLLVVFVNVCFRDRTVRGGVKVAFSISSLEPIMKENHCKLSSLYTHTYIVIHPQLHTCVMSLNLL